MSTPYTKTWTDIEIRAFSLDEDDYPKSCGMLSSTGTPDATTGFFLRGLVVARKTSDEKLYPYDHTQADGRQTPLGILAETVDPHVFNSYPVTLIDKPVAYYIRGIFRLSKLSTLTGDLATALAALNAVSNVYEDWVKIP